MKTQSDDEVLRAFNRTNKEFDDTFHALALRLGMTDSAFCIFYTIAELGDGCLQRDICRETYTNKQTINSAVRKLEQDGFLYLEAAGGRDKHIRLTEKGKDFLRQHICPVIRMETEAFMDLTPEERRECLRLFQKYVAGFRARALTL